MLGDRPSDDPVINRGRRLLRAIDGGDPAALSRLDAVLVELSRRRPGDPDVLRLRAHYAERQWSPRRRGTVILRAVDELLHDLEEAGPAVADLLPRVRVLAGVEAACRQVLNREPPRLDSALAEAAAHVITSAGDASVAAARFTRLLLEVLTDQRDADDAIGFAQASRLPLLLCDCLHEAGRAIDWRRASDRLA